MGPIAAAVTFAIGYGDDFDSDWPSFIMADEHHTAEEADRLDWLSDAHRANRPVAPEDAPDYKEMLICTRNVGGDKRYFQASISYPNL